MLRRRSTGPGAGWMAPARRRTILRRRGDFINRRGHVRAHPGAAGPRILRMDVRLPCLEDRLQRIGVRLRSVEVRLRRVEVHLRSIICQLPDRLSGRRAARNGLGDRASAVRAPRPRLLGIRSGWRSTFAGRSGRSEAGGFAGRSRRGPSGRSDGVPEPLGRRGGAAPRGSPDGASDVRSMGTVWALTGEPLPSAGSPDPTIGDASPVTHDASSATGDASHAGVEVHRSPFMTAQGRIEVGGVGSSGFVRGAGSSQGGERKNGPTFHTSPRWNSRPGR